MALRLMDEAPDFTAETTEGTIRFHEWLGDSWGILFSHPADYTPVCTTELGYMANIAHEFARRNVKILAISVDPLNSHRGWISDINETQNANVSYPLIADPEKTICNIYGVWGEKKMYGRTYFGIKRTTFVIDGAGRIEKVFRKPKTASHAEQILQAAAR